MKKNKTMIFLFILPTVLCLLFMYVYPVGYDDFSYACFNDQSKEWAGYLNSIVEQPQIGGIFYNKDAFDACGITDTPKTWDEFLTV